MPELPEIEITVRDLRKKVLKRAFIDIWTDFPKMVKRPTFEEFREKIKNKKIQRIWRRGKNIIFDLSDGFSLLIHQKLTGHLLVGHWENVRGQWQAKEKGPLLNDPMNRFLHLIFWLDDGKMLALSDLRKFAKVELWKTKELLESEEIKEIGPEPLDRNFTFSKFKDILPKRGKIKQILMNQKIIAGIGNIYSDEILFEARINPFKDVSKLSEKELKEIFKAIKKILKKGIELQGASISDYRKISGAKGRFDEFRKVYRREGEKCPRCGTIIQLKKIGGRSAHYCPTCQK